MSRRKKPFTDGIITILPYQVLEGSDCFFVLYPAGDWVRDSETKKPITFKTRREAKRRCDELDEAAIGKYLAEKASQEASR